MKKKMYIKILACVAIILFVLPTFAPAMKIEKHEENNMVDDQSNKGSSSDTFFDFKVKMLMMLGPLPSVSACVVKNNEIVWYEGYGKYDGNKAPNKDTVYLLASITKSITATAVMQLVDKGEIGLDEDINDRLDFELRHPNYPKANITYRMLLAHHSSFGNKFDSLNIFWNQTETDVNKISLEKIIKDIVFSNNTNRYWSANYPGTKFEYSNAGYALLGYLVEIISGQTFNDYCKEHIFEPLEMYNTSFDLAELNKDNLAVPYTRFNIAFGFKIFYGLPHYVFKQYPAGSLRSSIEDLSHYLIAHMNGGVYKETRILNETLVDEMHKPHKPKTLKLFGSHFGLGFQVWQSFGKTNKIGHGGDSPGCHTHMWIKTKDNVGVIYFTNIELNTRVRSMFIRQMLGKIFLKKADKL